jgi:hypothetical protein
MGGSVFSARAEPAAPPGFGSRGHG